jgi:serine/threonine protein kinase
MCYSAVKDAPMSPIIAKSVLLQLLLACDHLHKSCIAHCDTAPSNFLISSPTVPDFLGILKLIDFGRSSIIESTNVRPNHGVVTVWYRPPELLLDDSHSGQKVDVGRLASIHCLFVTSAE